MSSTVTMTSTTTKIKESKGKEREREKEKEKDAETSTSNSTSTSKSTPTNSIPTWIRQAVHSDFHQNVFNFEDFVKNEVKVKLDNDNQICPSWLATSTCPKGLSCPNRHVHPSSLNFRSNQRDNTRRTVCKHWLRALCKKGDSCDFLHEYDLRRMPECRFFATFGFCNMGDECLYLHVEPRAKRRECEDYRRGFCRNGPNCLKKHLRRPICPLYLEGFCPKGPLCSLGHPKSNQPSAESRQSSPIVTVKPMTAEEAFGNGAGGGGGGGGGGRDSNTRGGGMDDSSYSSINMNSGGGGGGRRDNRRDGNTHSNNNNNNNPISSTSRDGFQVLNIPPDQLASMIASGTSTTTILKNGQVRDYSKIECFKCGNFGHFANHCPNPLNKSVQDRRRN